MTAWRTWLEAETVRCREAVHDAERWLARWESAAREGEMTEEVERATALRDVAVTAWHTHRELCEWFAGWSAPIVERHLRMVEEFRGVRL